MRCGEEITIGTISSSNSEVKVSSSGKSERYRGCKGTPGRHASVNKHEYWYASTYRDRHRDLVHCQNPTSRPRR